MNLFTTYTKEEVNFLLSLKNKKIEEFDDLSRVKYFRGVDKKEFKYIYVKKLSTKEVIADYDFVIVLKGELAIVENKKILKKIKENEIYGISNLVNKKRDILITLKESEILFFQLKNGKSMFFYNLLIFECLKSK